MNQYITTLIMCESIPHHAMSSRFLLQFMICIMIQNVNPNSEP